MRATLERRDALVRSGARALATAWVLVKGFSLPAVLLDPEGLTPSGDPVLDPAQAMAWWEQRPRDGVGVKLGAQRGGAHALVGVQAATWSRWQSWLQANAVFETLRPWDEDATRGSLQRDMRPLSAPVIVRWMGQPQSGYRSISYKGSKQEREAVEKLRRASVGEDLGGSWCGVSRLIAAVCPRRARGARRSHRTHPPHRADLPGGAVCCAGGWSLSWCGAGPQPG
jgi:hypothetical protein